MLLSRNLIIKKMHHQLQQAEKSKQIRLQPTKQGSAAFYLIISLA
jgi:hypothetical protein